MHEDQKEMLDGYGFHFMDEQINHPIRLIGIGRESRCLESYYLDNNYRPECYLFQYTISGHGYLYTNEQEHMITPGQAFLLHMPGKERYYYKKDSSEPWEFYYLLFDGNAVVPYFNYIQSHSGMILTFSEYHPAIELLIQLHTDAILGKLRDPFSVSSRVYEFMCHLCRNCNTTSVKYSSLVSLAIETLKKEYTSSEGISALAAKLHVSTSHLSREFTRETGMPPIEYQRRLRLEKAVKLLSTTNLSIDEIAISCGFSCGNYFDKVFKRWLRMSPKNFREYVRQNGYQNIQI